jgi:hypothetical protein
MTGNALSACLCVFCLRTDELSPLRSVSPPSLRAGRLWFRAECRIVRRIDACPRRVYWSESGDVVVLACDASFYVLKYNRDLVQKFFEQNVEVGEQGIENAFDIEKDVAEKVRTGTYTNTQRQHHTRRCSLQRTVHSA